MPPKKKDIEGLQGLYNEKELKKIQSAEDMADLKAFAEEECWRRVLNTYEGRKVVYDILGFGDIYELNGEPPLETAPLNRQIGRRSMALQVLHAALTANEGVFIVMQREGQEFEEQFTYRDPDEGLAEDEFVEKPVEDDNEEEEGI